MQVKHSDEFILLQVRQVYPHFAIVMAY